MENGSIFGTPVERRGTGSIKWDVADGELPMWVADMDFPTAPPVRRAIERRAAHGVFGYTDVSGAWSDAYIGWWCDRHAFTMQREWLIFCTGVVPAISSIVRKLTTPAEKVLIQTPVYNIFFNSILNNGRVPIESPLVYEGGRYRIDFADLEQKLSDPQTTLMLLCDPHNPAGCLWTKEELAQIGALCARHHVTVVSDEIHCDLTDPGHEYVPFLSVSEECRRIGIACVAPTKAFGIPGIQTAAVVVPDPLPWMRRSRPLPRAARGWTNCALIWRRTKTRCAAMRRSICRGCTSCRPRRRICCGWTAGHTRRTPTGWRRTSAAARGCICLPGHSTAATGAAFCA